MTDWRAVGRKRRKAKLDVHAKLWAAQGERCCYCDQPMARQGTTRAEEAARLGIAAADVPRRRVTREHLKRRAEGGTDQRDNLALACKHCNVTRGDMNWLIYKSYRMGELSL